MKQKIEFTKVLGRIRELKLTQAQVSEQLKISLPSLNRKLKGLQPWKDNEMESLINLLEIKTSEIPDYFFPEVLRKRNNK